MYSGKRRARVLAQRLGVRAPRPCSTRPAACLRARPRAPAPPRPTRPPRAAKPRLDLPQLDAEAAHLHLRVVAAQELDGPVRQPPPDVARLVHPRARFAAQTGPPRTAPPSAPVDSGSRARRRRRRCRSHPLRPPARARGTHPERTTRVLPIGRPSGMLRASAPTSCTSCVSANVVVSVGPYPFRRCCGGPSRSTRPITFGSSASPPTMR